MEIQAKTQNVRQTISDPQNYKILLKGFGSKNQSVILSLHKIITMIGGIESRDRVRMFAESNASTFIVQQYVQNSSMYTRYLILQILISLLSGKIESEISK